jgi:hypothetical protein
VREKRRQKKIIIIINLTIILTRLERTLSLMKQVVYEHACVCVCIAGNRNNIKVGGVRNE